METTTPMPCDEAMCKMMPEMECCQNSTAGMLLEKIMENVTTTEMPCDEAMCKMMPEMECCQNGTVGMLLEKIMENVTTTEMPCDEAMCKMMPEMECCQNSTAGMLLEKIMENVTTTEMPCDEAMCKMMPEMECCQNSSTFGMLLEKVMDMPCDEAMCKMMPEMECCKENNTVTDMSMQMWFEFSTHSTILFKNWKTTDATSFAWSAVIVFLIAFSFEAIKYLRVVLNERAIAVRKNNLGSGNDKISQARMISKSHLIQTLLHACQIIVSYFLMLIFMTFNAGLCIVVIAGEVCGYLVFGWRKRLVSDLDGHCG